VFNGLFFDFLKLLFWGVVTFSFLIHFQLLLVFSNALKKGVHVFLDTKNN
jgi:hypothetical protein